MNDFFILYVLSVIFNISRANYTLFEDPILPLYMNPFDSKSPNIDRLKRTLLKSKQPLVPPSPNVQVKLCINITHVNFNALQSKLDTEMEIFMSWSDPSLAWDPNKYNGIKTIIFNGEEIWKPIFFAIQSTSTDALNTNKTVPITVVSSGKASLYFHGNLITWCRGNSEINMWPYDEYRCSIYIEPWVVDEIITLQPMKDNSIVELSDHESKSEWEIVKLNQKILTGDRWRRFRKYPEGTPKLSDRLIMRLDIIRRPTMFDNIVFYTPLLVLLTLLLISFWSEPLKMSRIWFYTACVIVICAVLSNVTLLVPGDSIPNILVLYRFLLYGTLLAILVQVIPMTSLVEKLCRTTCMQSFLFSSALKVLCCLPRTKISENDDFSQVAGESTKVIDKLLQLENISQEECDLTEQVNKLSEGENIAQDASGLTESVNKITKNKYLPRLAMKLAKVIDRLMFLGYLISTGILLYTTEVVNPLIKRLFD